MDVKSMRRERHSQTKMAADLTVISSAVVIQAHVRGFLIRRKLLEVRKEFEEVVKELERDSRMVCWKREGLRMPLINSDPKVCKSEKEKNTALNRGNCRKITRNQALMKEEFGIDADGESMLSNTVQDGNHSDTEEHFLEKKSLKVSKLHRDQIVDQRSAEYEGAMLETSSHSERYDGDILVPENEMNPSQRVIQKEVRTCPAEQSSKKLESVDLNAEMWQCDCPRDQCPHKRTDSSGFVLPLSSTLNPASFNEQEMKGKAVYKSTSEALLQGCVHKRPYLRDQAVLSESWMSDMSFDPVDGDKTIAVTDLPSDTVKLRELRDHIGMELLWTEQAIESRKKYLGLRKSLSPGKPEGDSTLD